MAGLEYLTPEGLRLDGRRAGELRKLQARLGGFEQADGSAYIEQGNTKVLVTIYGPHEGEARSRQHNNAVVNCQFSMATFSTGERRRRPKGDRRSTEMSKFIQDAFEAAILTEQFPQSQIDIYVQILQGDGGHLSACINCASLAVMDAGIPLRGFVSSCSAAMVDDDAILDVNYLEETCGPQLTLALLAQSEKVILCQLGGPRLHMDRLDNIMSACTKGCLDVFTVLKGVVSRHVQEGLVVQGTT